MNEYEILLAITLTLLGVVIVTTTILALKVGVLVGKKKAESDIADLVAAEIAKSDAKDGVPGGKQQTPPKVAGSSHR